MRRPSPRSSNMALTGATWSDFVHLGAKSFPVASLLSGTDYYAFAFGLDRGAITTDISKKPFRTAAAELTDDCTFDIRFVEIGASTVDVEIVPSNSSNALLCDFHGVLYPRNAHAGRSGCYENQ